MYPKTPMLAIAAAGTVIIAVVVVWLLVANARRLTRLLGEGQFGLKKLMPDSADWIKLRDFIAGRFAHSKQSLKLKHAYKRGNDNEFLYRLTDVSTRQAGPSNRGTCHAATEYVVMRATCFTTEFTIRSKINLGAVGQFAFGMLRAMGMNVTVLEEGLSEEFKEFFTIMLIDAPEAKPQIPTGLQQVLVKHARNSQIDWGLLNLLNRDGFLVFDERGFLIKFSEMRPLKDPRHIQTALRIIDDIKQQVVR